MRIAILAVLVAIGVTMGVAPARAHHATTKFDSKRVERITGEVTGLTWKSPHVKIDIGPWTVEMQAPRIMTREGWKRDSLAIGDHVTIFANPLRKDDSAQARRLAWYVGIILADGRTLGRVQEAPAVGQANGKIILTVDAPGSRSR